MQSIRIRLTKDNQVRYLFNRGVQWFLLREDGNQEQLAMITSEPVLLALGMEDHLAIADGECVGRAFKLAKLFCPDFKLNLVPTGSIKGPTHVQPAAEVSPPAVVKRLEEMTVADLGLLACEPAGKA
jgi:hypothetical protein